MGLLQTEIEVGINSANYKYYESLGYEIPRYYNKDHCKWMIKTGTTIIVKVEDLSPTNHIRVDVECDECHIKKPLTYISYYRGKRDDGKYYCIHCAYKVCFSGENNIRWDFSKTPEERARKRKYPEYVQFVKAVLARDNYKCQCCGQDHGELDVHHLDGYSWCKEKRTDTTNGITLCRNCHDNFHILYGKKHNTKEQFAEWIGHAIELLNYTNTLPSARQVYCIEENRVYDSVEALKKEWNVHTNVHTVCDRNNKHYKSVKGKHLLWYDEYLTMTSEEVKQYVEELKIYGGKTVICLTTGEIFPSIAHAQKMYPQCGSIWSCCKGIIKTSGVLPDGTRLEWAYYTKDENK